MIVSDVKTSDHVREQDGFAKRVVNLDVEADTVIVRPSYDS